MPNRPLVAAIKQTALRTFARDARSLRRLQSNYRSISAAGAQQLREALERLWFEDHPLREMFDAKDRQACWDALLYGRLNNSRQSYIPWIDHALTIEGKTILEIGCGSGPGTITLLEQGAKVVGMDVNEDHMTLGRTRLALYGFKNVPLINILGDGFQALSAQSFDSVIFFASLEHMYLDERLRYLRKAHELLKPGGHLIILECPNRFWHNDSHTAALPFFNWLPHDLAFAYAKNSSTAFVRALGAVNEQANYDLLVREGRGASYHEIELGLGEHFSEYRVVSSLLSYQDTSNRLVWLNRRLSQSADVRYTNFLASRAPGVHKAFFEPHLNVVLRKSTASSARIDHRDCAAG